MVAFQNSKVEWLGEIPKHWSITKLKNQCQIIPSNVDKKSHDDETEIRLCNYTDVYYNEFIDDSIEYMVATANEHELKKFQLFKGDVLITKDSEDPHDIAVPAVVVRTQPKLLCGYHLSIIRSDNRNFNGSYLFWVLRDASIASQLHREATGITRWAIANRHVKNSIIPLPPETEQKAIASYLRKTCAAIDNAIEAKQKQLEILDALRKSIIHKAVTRGLDYFVELKDSGVEWLGKIPRHWDIRRIKDIVALNSGDSITSDNITQGGNYPVFGGNGLRGFTSSYTHDGYYVLIGRQGALCGNINYAEGKFWASEHAVVATTLRKHDTFWLGELLRAMNLNQYSNAAAQPGLAVEKIKFLRLPVPSYEEQHRITSFIRGKIVKNEELVSNLQNQISTLEQYRKSLIHECVTGKRRVNEDNAGEQ